MPVTHVALSHTLAAAAVAGLTGLYATGAHASADLAVNDTQATPGRTVQALQFQVTRSGDAGFAVSVNYATRDGTAKAGTDYTPTNGTLTFAPGETSRIVQVALTGKPVLRPKSFTLELTNAVASTASAVAFGAAGVAAIGANSEGAAVGDFNGDGKPDLVVASTDGSVRVLRNDTADGSTNANFAPVLSLGPVAGAFRPGVADINRDGRPDIVVSSLDSNRAAVFINTTPAGSPTLSFVASTVQLPDFGFTTSVDFADFDGDGIVDIVLANPGSSSAPGSNRVFVLRNTTPVGATTAVLAVVAQPQASPSLNSYAYVVRALDANGDGRPDLAVANLASSEVSILRNTTAPGASISFAAPIALPTAGGASGLAVADLNGDGKPDLASANNTTSQTGASWSVLLNTTPAGTSVPTFAVTNFSGGAPYSLALADVDRDGKPDVLLANLAADSFGGGAIDVYLNQTPTGAASPSFSKAFSAPAGDEPHFVSVADFNRDGLVDFVSADFSSTLAGFRFGVKRTASPQARITDPSGTATLERRVRE